MNELSGNLIAYFKRINYKNALSISEETLKNIVIAQNNHIPFENLEIHQTDFKEIKLDETSLFNKLVFNQRGGYCHENNELLALVLEQLGFNVERLLARVLIGPQPLPLGHKLLLVTIESEKWICDAGFGGNGLIEPIRLIPGKSYKQFSESFKFRKENDDYVLQTKIDGKWSDLYAFNLVFYKAIDYVPFNFYVSKSPDSLFVTNRIAVRTITNGNDSEKIILNNYKITIRKNNQKEAILLTEHIYADTVKKYFGIELPKNISLKPLPVSDKRFDADNQTSINQNNKKIASSSISFYGKPK